MNNNRLYAIMIGKPTVFILGAGASVPYGYPTGEGLRKDICDHFVDRIRFIIGISPASLTVDLEPLARQFRDVFFKSSTRSIDLFLSRNPQFADIGKLAILTSILDAERHSAFREYMLERFRSQDWYSYLFHKMTEDLSDPADYEKFYQNEVTFITYNYDRSLEYIFYDSLINSFNAAPLPNIQNQFNKMKIYHVYGIVDKLPPQKGFYTHYGNEATPLTTLGMMSKNIKIVHERTIPEEDIKLMKVAIKDDSRIFFLGFGYAKENLEILGIPELFNGDQEIYGTAFNFTGKEIRETREILNKYFKVKSAHLENPRIINTDCLGLLREYL